ncbi:non-homologous end-joining factor 1 isoform X2 [Molothrus ater]|nr:non-homologous end-joining factor 1 isoform X2 [Molothrus ater]
MCPLLAGQPGATTAFSCHRSPSGLRLHVKSELSGLPFYWDFHCCPAPLDMVSRHLVRPLIQMNLVLQCQVQELISLLLQKDAEIEDYRESGATLSRDRLRTEPFREETFQQNFVAETLPRICSAGEGQAFASALQQLYTAVTQQELKQARKRHCSEDNVETAPSAETTKHPHSPAASQEDETTSSSERTSPPPQLRSPGCLQPRPSQRRQKGSSAEGLLPTLLRSLLPPASKRGSADNPCIDCSSLHLLVDPAHVMDGCLQLDVSRMSPVGEMELLSSTVFQETAFLTLPWCRVCSSFLSWQSQCWT